MTETLREQTWDWKTLLAPAAGPLSSRQKQWDGSCFSSASKSGAEWRGMECTDSRHKLFGPFPFFFPGFVRRHLVSAGFFEFQMWHSEGSKSFIHWSDCETRRWVLKHLGSLPDRRSVITQLQGGVAAFNQVARLFFTFVFAALNLCLLNTKAHWISGHMCLTVKTQLRFLFCNRLHS